MSYTAEQVMRILPSVYDREGFIGRGGKHAPQERSEDMENKTKTFVDVHASMSGICEVIDVERALAKQDADYDSFLRACVEDTDWLLASQSRMKLFHELCEKVAQDC